MNVPASPGRVNGAHSIPPVPDAVRANLAPPFAGRGRPRSGRVRGEARRSTGSLTLGSVAADPQGGDPGWCSASPLHPNALPAKSGARERAAVVAALFSKRPRDRLLRLVLDAAQM